jgi:hypothetical protein
MEEEKEIKMQKINERGVSMRFTLFVLVTSLAFLTAFVENRRAAAADLTGTWYYTALVDENGKVTQMANRESWLTLKKNGDYEQRVFTGTLIGTYSVAGNRLTLKPENSDARVYTVVLEGGNKLTLKATNGSAYKLERGD